MMRTDTRLDNEFYRARAPAYVCLLVESRIIALLSDISDKARFGWLLLVAENRSAKQETRKVQKPSFLHCTYYVPKARLGVKIAIFSGSRALIFWLPSLVSAADVIAASERP
jgi:hypothetical protein